MKYIPQQELELITNPHLLDERDTVLTLISNNQFDLIKNYKSSEESTFLEIQDILDKVTPSEQIFIKNYYSLPSKLKADLKINSVAIKKNPYIYFALNNEATYLKELDYAKILMQTCGSFYTQLELPLMRHEEIAKLAIINDPSVFKELLIEFRNDKTFIESALHKNALIYPHLSLNDRRNPLFLKIVLIYNIIPAEAIFKAIPRSLKKSRADIMSIMKIDPYYFKFLTLKHRADKKIALYGVQADFNLLKFVDKKLHQDKDILLAFFLYHLNDSYIEKLIYEYQLITNSELSSDEILSRLIKAYPVNKIMGLAKEFSMPCLAGLDRSISININKKNMLEFLKKKPQTFKYLVNSDQLYQINACYFCAIAVLALKLDYKNFQYIQYYHFSKVPKEEDARSIYTKLFEVSVRYFKNNGEKGAHPYKWAVKNIMHLRDIERIVTKKSNGKINIDYKTIFLYGPAKYKKIKKVYVNALNADPKLANYLPLTKETQISIFEGLNKKALEALFPLWVRFLKIKDVLEIAHLKNEIFSSTTQTVA